jgi:co-chaperonin GroES (HSP10)
MIRPLFGNVLLRPIKEDEKAGIILKPDPNAPQRGEVIDVGEGDYIPTFVQPPLQQHQCGTSFAGLIPFVPTYPLAVQRGDKVLFEKTRGKEVLIDQIAHYIIHQQDILGVEF